MAPSSLFAVRTFPARRRLLAIFALALVGVSAGQLSLALFTDQASADAVFDSGSVVLDDAEIAALTLSASGLMPGSSVTDDVVVQNDGSGQLRYAMSTASTDPDGKGLRDALTVTVRTVDVTTPGTPCDDFDGAIVLAETALGASSAGFGDPAIGGDSGDRVLDAGASESLCFRVALPIGTGNAYQSAATTTTFTFDAEQTANNP